MKRNNIPLNFKEKNNSKISLYCSVAVLLLLFFCFHQLDYSLITKPETEAKEAAAQTGAPFGASVGAAASWFAAEIR